MYYINIVFQSILNLSNEASKIKLLKKAKGCFYELLSLPFGIQFFSFLFDKHPSTKVILDESIISFFDNKVKKKNNNKK